MCPSLPTLAKTITLAAWFLDKVDRHRTFRDIITRVRSHRSAAFASAIEELLNKSFGFFPVARCILIEGAEAAAVLSCRASN